MNWRGIGEYRPGEVEWNKEGEVIVQVEMGSEVQIALEHMHLR